jgi:alpha-ribazole phosphatase
MMSATSNTLFLVRHATPDVKKGVCYGRLDLNTIASDAQILHNKLMALLPRNIDLHTSPLQRCASTAHQLAAAGWPKPTVDERLAEMHFGDWEGKPWNDIERAQIDAWAADIVNYRPPNGESVRDVATRALACIASLSFEKDTVLVTHAGVMQVLNKLLLKQPLENFSANKIDYGAIIQLQRTKTPEGIVTFTVT